MPRRHYRTNGGSDRLPKRTFTREDDLVDALQSVTDKSTLPLTGISVHVYEGTGLGRTYLGVRPTRHVVIRGQVKEEALQGT